MIENKLRSLIDKKLYLKSSAANPHPLVAKGNLYLKKVKTAMAVIGK
ncbi:hypothetical protein [Succinatimonas hippei]|nr:hypothetical protein [Succinatimonas hippei]